MNRPPQHRVQVELNSLSDHHGVLRSPASALEQAGPTPLFGGPAGQRGGNPDWWNPEQLLLAATSLSLMTGFLAQTARAAITVYGYFSRAEAMIEPGPDGLTITGITVHVELRVDARGIEHALGLLHESVRLCAVGRALRSPVVLTVATSTD